MNLTHLHLLLNHAPVLGSAFGLGLFLFGAWQKSDLLKKTALGVFVIVALMAVPVYFTGEPAAEVAGPLPGVFKPLIEQHETVATIAFTGGVVLGATALTGLIFFRRGKLVPAWFGSLLVAVSLIVNGLMAWTANLGGQIRHSEIRSNADSSAVIGNRSRE